MSSVFLFLLDISGKHIHEKWRIRRFILKKREKEGGESSHVIVWLRKFGKATLTLN